MERQGDLSSCLPSCCWGRVWLSACSEEAERHCWEQSLSTEQSQRSAPLDTFDLHISIRFHIRTPAFPQLAPAPFPPNWPATLNREAHRKVLLAAWRRCTNTWQHNRAVFSDIITISCSVLAITVGKKHTFRDTWSTVNVPQVRRLIFSSLPNWLLYFKGALLICLCWASTCGIVPSAPDVLICSLEVWKPSQAVGLGTARAMALL